MLTPLVSSLTNPIPALVPAAWFRGGYGVTGTLTASNWADQSGNGRDLAQATGGNQPIYLPYSGTAYAYIPAVASNYFSTPDSVANSITGDIDLRFCAALDNWENTGQAFCGKRSSGNSYQFTSGATTNTPIFYWWQGAVLKSAEANSAWSIAAGVKKHIRVTLDVDNGSGGCDARFYTSDDGETWVQLGTTVTQAFTASIDDTASTLDVGTDGSAGYLLVGKIYRAQIYNGINGTLAVDFNPADFAETSTNGATAVSSTTGETWTLNSSGAKPSQVVKSANLLTDQLRYMATGAFTLTGATTTYVVCKSNVWAASTYLLDGITTNSLGLGEFAGSTPDLGFVGPIANNGGLAIGTKGIVTAVENGASSSITINAGTPVTGNHATGAKGGLTFNTFGGGTTGANNGQWQVWEIIIFSAAHTAAQRASVQQWLNSVHHVY